MYSTAVIPSSSSSEASSDDDEFLRPVTDPRLEAEERVFNDSYPPRKRRKTHGRTSEQRKESAALGVFGSDSENEVSGRRQGRGSSRFQRPLRSKGIGFVSGGVKKAEEGEDEDSEENVEEERDAYTIRDTSESAARPQSTLEDEDDVEMDATPSATPGLGAARGLGFKSSISHSRTAGPHTPLGKGFVPSSASIPSLHEDQGSSSVPSKPRVAQHSAFSATPGGRSKSGSSALNTGSFAARMMAKMGYKEGQGLGKEGQGRSGVIEVTLRPQGVGLGAVREKSKQEREEEKRQARSRGEEVISSDEERPRPKRKAKASGNASGASTPRRAAKPKYQTVEEIAKVAPGLDIPEAFRPILDLTGREQRYLTSSSGLLTPTSGMEVEKVEDIEGRKLARRAQNELSAFVEEWKNLGERKAYISMQAVEQDQAIAEQASLLDRAKQLLSMFEELTMAVENCQWDPILETLERVTVQHIEDDVSGDTSSLAVAAIHPLLSQRTEGWQPLEDPRLENTTLALTKIRRVLGYTTNADRPKARHKTTPYESMIQKLIFPRLVSAINTWHVYEPAPMLALFEAWDPLLPAFLRDQIIEQALINKLNSAVAAWNPRKRRSNELPHLWLFPWLQHLPPHHSEASSHDGLVSDVKRKFRQVIDTWDFRKGVIDGLDKWREVLQPRKGKDHWTPLMMNHVLPSISRFLRNPSNFQIDPNDQAPYMAALQSVLAWNDKDILSSRVLSQVVVDVIFPMWHEVLHQWLTVVGPNEEIGQWFEWWRDEVFPEKIKGLPSVQSQFQKGHEMIIQALDLGNDVPSLPLPAKESPPSPQRSPTPPPTTATSHPTLEPTVRSQVEDWCAENDLQFLPEKKVLHSAGPLYRITAAANGKLGVLVYFRGDNLWAVQKRGKDVDAGQDLLIQWSVEEGRDVLLAMAWTGVK